jgi:hypothetical protein
VLVKETFQENIVKVKIDFDDNLPEVIKYARQLALHFSKMAGVIDNPVLRITEDKIPLDVTFLWKINDKYSVSVALSILSNYPEIFDEHFAVL